MALSFATEPEFPKCTEFKWPGASEATFAASVAAVGCVKL